MSLVACTCDNCHAHCYYSLFVMIIFSILMVPVLKEDYRSESIIQELRYRRDVRRDVGLSIG